VATLTLFHSCTTGTILRGTRYGDGTALVLKSLGWRWDSRTQRWYLPGSRPDPATSSQTAVLSSLQAAGLDVIEVVSP